ncbi:MAG: PTS sugar transporter subunit IIC [Halanaerobiales bacterium]|nr:PTS sugar transporter subunit IIC [Halanaerobiales bacterium]
MTLYQIYLWVGFVALGLIDLYLARFPIFHPIVLVSIVGWFWNDLQTGLVVGGMLELIFGIARMCKTHRLNLVLFAGGLTIYLNQQTYNINLVLSMTFALLVAIGLHLLIEPLQDWLKGLSIVVVSGMIVFLLPFTRELFGFIPAQLLNQIAVAGGVLPWIFFAYAIWGLIDRTSNRKIIIGIPAILVGSILNMRAFIWGPLVFVIIFYFLDYLFKARELPALRWINLGLILCGIYLMLPDLAQPTLLVFTGLLALNILLVVRKFNPLEIYLIVFVAGIILSQGGYLH